MGDRYAAVVAALVIVATAAAATPALAQGDEQQVVGNPDLTFSTSAGSLEPGSATQIPISVLNRGEVHDSGPTRHEERVQTAQGVVVSVSGENTPIRVDTGELTVGDVPDSSTRTIGQLSLSVPADVDPGTYRLEVDYEYEYTRVVDQSGAEAEYDDRRRTREGYIEVTVDEQAQFTVEDVSSSVLAGQNGEVSVTFRNAGSQSARDASVTAASLSGEFGFGSGNPTATSYVGRWEPGAKKTVTFEAAATPQASPGNYSVETSISYSDSSGMDETAGPITVGVPVGEEQNFALTDVESTLRIGYEGRVQATLVNEGPQPLSNPVAILNVSDPRLTVTSPDVALPDLQPGERAGLNFSVDVSNQASPQPKQVPVIVTWQSDSGDTLTTQPLRPTVQIQPRQERFGVEALNSSVPVGGSRTVEIRVTNQGTQQLSDVEAKAYYTGALSGEDDSGYIPELAPGETKSFLVDVGADPGTNQEDYPLEVDFRYDLPTGTSEVSDTYRVPIEVTEPDSGGGWLPLLGGIAIAALVGGAIVYRRRLGRPGAVSIRADS